MSEIIHSAKVSEIGGVGGVLAIDAEIAAQVVQDDPDPQFVTVEIESGWSKNDRYWPASILDNVAAQVNEKHPVGYQGHIEKGQEGQSLPDPQTIWIKAITIATEQGKKLIVKGYNLPNAKIRQWAKRGAVNSVSLYGDAELEPVKGGHRVTAIDLESIDWSRKLKEGMPTKLVAVTAEMKGDGEVEPKEIGKLTFDELTEHNPSLVSLISDRASAKAKEAVSEIEGKNEKLTEEVSVLTKVKEALGIEKDADPVAALVLLTEKVGEAVKGESKKIIQKVLDARYKDDRSKRLVTMAVGEMEQGELDAEKFETAYSEAIDEALKNNEDVAELVAEMTVKAKKNDDASTSGGTPLSDSLKKTNQTTNPKHENEFLTLEVAKV